MKFPKKCPECNSARIRHTDFIKNNRHYLKFECKRCGYLNVKEFIRYSPSLIERQTEVKI